MVESFTQGRVEKSSTKISRISLIYIILILLLLIGIFYNINCGSVDLSLKEIKDILFLNDSSTIPKAFSNIIWKIRIPRLLMAAILGGGLSISGYLLQTFFKNPIAGPYVLGISAGAKLFVGLIMLTSVSFTKVMASSYELFLAGFIGAMLSMLIVLMISKKVENISMLLVIGMMIGYVCSAVTDFMITFSESAELEDFTMWSMGSFASATWDNVIVSAIIVFPTVVLVFLISKPLNTYMLGESYAKSMGVNIKLFRIILIVLSSVLAACATAFAGPISFVGIAVPQIARLLFKTSSPRIIVPGIFLCGCTFCLYCDLFARTIFSPMELALSTVTSFLGAPVVIYLLIKRRK